MDRYSKPPVKLKMVPTGVLELLIIGDPAARFGELGSTTNASLSRAENWRGTMVIGLQVLAKHSQNNKIIDNKAKCSRRRVIIS
jgi:hypothetical protein